MKISVIVPVYNTEKYLNKCLDSILAQTFTDFELLLIDDGSTDNSGKICDEYAAKDNRVKVFHKENGGVSRARNLGLDNASGEYLSFIDSDDYIRPEMYAELLAVADKYNVDLVTSDLEINCKIINNGDLPSNKVIDIDYVIKKLRPAFTFNNSMAIMEFKNKIFRKDVVAHCRFPEGICFQEDLIYMVQVYCAVKTVYYLAEAYYEYVPLPTGLYSAYRKTDGVNFVKARGIMLSLVDKYDIAIDTLNFNVSYLYNISWFTFRTLRLKDKKERKALIKEVLTATETISACEYLKENATSFDRRIANAIARGKLKKAVFLIKFVYSGKAAKLQKFIAKLKGKK